MLHKSKIYILLPGHNLYGQEKALITVAELLRSNGASVKFILHKSWGIGDISSELKNRSFNWSLYPLGNLWSRNRPQILLTNLISLLICSFLFFQEIRSEKPDLLITGNYTFTLYLLPTIYVTRQKVLFRFGDDLPAHHFLLKLVNTLILKACTGTVANCNYLADKISQAFNIERPSVIYNKAPINPALKERNILETGALKASKDNRVKILYVGQISKHKGVDVLLKAFLKVHEKNPNVELYLIGKIPGVGEYRERTVISAIQSIKEVIPGQVKWLGFVPNPANYFLSADVHVCPSVNPDPSPNVIAEAKAFGIPSVVFPVGGLPELVDHLNDGFICESTSIEALTEGILYFVSDKKLRVDAGYQALTSVKENFSDMKFRESWLNYIEKILSLQIL